MKLGAWIDTSWQCGPQQIGIKFVPRNSMDPLQANSSLHSYPQAIFKFQSSSSFNCRSCPRLLVRNIYMTVRLLLMSTQQNFNLKCHYCWYPTVNGCYKIQCHIGRNIWQGIWCSQSVPGAIVWPPIKVKPRFVMHIWMYALTLVTTGLSFVIDCKVWKDWRSLWPH